LRKVQLQYGVKQFAVVAHSMGGLVSRGFLQRYRAGGATASIPLFISISRPGWAQGAEMGLKTAPVDRARVVDMAPGSDYLKSAVGSDTGVPHYLCFPSSRAACRGEGNDGVVTVSSQLQAGCAAERGAHRGLQRDAHGRARGAERVAAVNELLAKNLLQKQ